MPAVTVTRTITFHLTDAGRDSIRNTAERLEMISKLYADKNAPQMASTLNDTADLLSLVSDGQQSDYLLDVAEGLRGFVKPISDG